MYPVTKFKVITNTVSLGSLESSLENRFTFKQGDYIAKSEVIDNETVFIICYEDYYNKTNLSYLLESTSDIDLDNNCDQNKCFFWFIMNQVLIEELKTKTEKEINTYVSDLSHGNGNPILFINDNDNNGKLAGLVINPVFYNLRDVVLIKDKNEIVGLMMRPIYKLYEHSETIEEESITFENNYNHFEKITLGIMLGIATGYSLLIGNIIWKKYMGIC